MDVRRPIFVIGAGRTGSTEFHNVLSRHPRVTWLTGYCARRPALPALNRCVLRALDYPVVGRYLDRRLFRGECYDFWDYYCRGFSQPVRDLTVGDATQSTIDRLPKVFAGMLSRRRDRLLVKITGWPRVGYLRAIFPDALFIHLIRDGRAVVNSLLHCDFWRGWAGPQNWRWGDLTVEQQMEWQRHNRSFVALASIQWKIFMEAARQAKEQVPAGSFLESRYEDMCDCPLELFRRVTEFCDLEWSPRFEAAVRGRVFRNQNDKWRKDLTPDQQRTLESVLGDELARLGYDLEPPRREDCMSRSAAVGAHYASLRPA